MPPSLPSRGAWIEICVRLRSTYFRDRSLPSRGAWIEMADPAAACACSWSLPSRGAWIEMFHALRRAKQNDVAPLAGSVDRNSLYTLYGRYSNLSLPSRGAWIEICKRRGTIPFCPRRSPRGERG